MYIALVLILYKEVIWYSFVQWSFLVIMKGRCASPLQVKAMGKGPQVQLLEANSQTRSVN
jgi:hypothetical protein